MKPLNSYRINQKRSILLSRESNEEDGTLPEAPDEGDIDDKCDTDHYSRNKPSQYRINLPIV